MRCFLIILLSLLFFSIYSQEDTTSSMSMLYNQSMLRAKQKADSIRKAMHNFGCAIYGGIGEGGNISKTGFASGTGASFHYKFHTINMYASLATKSEAISFQNDKSYTLYSSNYGIMYGLGAYDKNASVSIGVGIGYSRTNMILQEGPYNVSVNGYAPGYVPVYYSKVGACIGGQATAGGKFIRLSMQFYVNISNTITNYTVLGGLAIVIR
jgi:hypothetical protein